MNNNNNYTIRTAVPQVNHHPASLHQIVAHPISDAVNARSSMMAVDINPSAVNPGLSSGSPPEDSDVRSLSLYNPAVFESSSSPQMGTTPQFLDRRLPPINIVPLIRQGHANINHTQHARMMVHEYPHNPHQEFTAQDRHNRGSLCELPSIRAMPSSQFTFSCPGPMLHPDPYFTHPEFPTYQQQYMQATYDLGRMDAIDNIDKDEAMQPLLNGSGSRSPHISPRENVSYGRINFGPSRKRKAKKVCVLKAPPNPNPCQACKRSHIKCVVITDLPSHLCEKCRKKGFHKCS